MRIAFDARSYFMRTGIARYTRGLAHALAAAPGAHEWLFLISDQHLPQELDFGDSPVEVRQSRAPWLGGRAEREVLAAEASAWKADLFHAVFPPQALPGIPTLTTVFDFSPLSHPEVHQPVVRTAFADAWPGAGASARGFIAVSGPTADQLRARIIDPRPVWTVPAGLSAPFDRFPGRAENGPRSGVIAVGTIEPRKNVGLLLDAARRLDDRGRRIAVTLVGKRGWGYPEFEEDLARTPGARWLQYITDNELLAAYRSAAIAAVPSILEGFGLPLLEAMAQGALPLVSPDPALLQLVGRRDLQLPLDAGEWSDALARWLDDHEGRDSVTHATMARARGYLWPAIVTQFHDIYESLA